MTTTDASTITVRPQWVCGVTRSGYHNGSTCRPDDPHSGWGCGYRYEISLPATTANAALLAQYGFRVIEPVREASGERPS